MHVSDAMHACWDAYDLLGLGDKLDGEGELRTYWAQSVRARKPTTHQLTIVLV